MAFKDLIKHAQELEKQGKKPAGAKSSQQIRRDAIERGVLPGLTAEAAEPKIQGRTQPQIQKLQVQEKKEATMAEKNPVDSLYLRKTFAENALKKFDESDREADIDWTDTNARKAYNAKRQRLQDAVDRAGAELDARENERYRAEIDAMGEEDRQLLAEYVENQDQRRSVFGQSNPIAWFQSYNKEEDSKNALVEKYGQERLDELAEIYRKNTYARQAEEEAAKAQAAVNKGTLSAIGQNILSVPLNVLTGVEALASRGYEAIDRTGQYKTLNPYNYGDVGMAYGQGVRQQTAQNIAGEKPNIVTQGTSAAYQGAMTLLDSIARAFFGGGAAGGATLAATNSFAQTMSEASQQGATPEQAALLATTTAGIEYLTEKIPLEKLIETAKGTGAKSVILNALRQAGIEATTEEASLIATVLAEAAILQEKSAYQQRITGLILDNVAPEEARRQANMDIVNEAVNTLFVSMFAGVLGSPFASYADYRGMFAAEQERSNPELAKPKAKNAEQARAELLQKYPELAQQQEQTTEAAQQPQTQPQEEVQQEVAPEQQQAVPPRQETQTAPQEVQQTEQAAQEQPFQAETRAQLWKQRGEQQTQQQTPVRQESTPQVDTQKESSQGGQVQNQQTVPNTEQAQQNQSTNVDGQTQEGAELQRERVNAVRPQEITVEDSQGRKVSEAAGNIYTSARTPDSFTDSIKRLVSEGRVSHDVQTNEQSLKMAAESIAKDGNIQNALNSIKEVADSGRTGAVDVAKGVLIYDELVNSNNPTDQALAEDCFTTLCQLATNTGRPMQLYSLFRKMTPESQVNVIRNEINRNIARMQKAGTVKKDYQAEVDPELLQMYQDAAAEHQKAKGDKAKRAAEEKMQDIQNVIYMTEAAKVPTTFKAKWDAWRYMAMLGNVKTQVRNVAGNAAMVPYSEVKRAIATVMEKGISKENRTKSFFQDKELLNWAKQDRVEPEVLGALKQSAKLGDQQANTVFQENVKTFGDSWVGERANELQGIINKAVQGGDLLFKNREYARSLAGFIKARGYTAADIQNKNVPVEVLNEARNYAVNEALKVTFNDSNMLSDTLSSVRFKNPGDNKVKMAMNMLGEGIMPFRKTPANIVMRFKDYSPLGLAQGVWNMAFNVHSGKVSAATAIDQIAGGITGSALAYLGYALAGGMFGIKLTGSGTDEDEQRQGNQNYALEFSVNGQQYSYTIDWASPANLPLFLGANLRAAAEAPDTASFITAMLNTAKGAAEPLLELSCLSSLNDMFESSRYAPEGEHVYTFLARGATSYFTQGVPSLARQTSQAMQETKQTTLVTSDDPVIKKAQTTAAGLGIGNLYKTDKITAWGEKESTGTTGERILNAFFNPGTLKKVDNSQLEQEINRINSTPGNNVTPPYMPKTITYTDSDGNTHENYRLSEQEYQAVAQTQGQTAKRILDTMINSDNYKAMSDAEKAKAINQVYSYARVKALVDNIENHTGYDEAWMMDLKEGKEAEEILRRTTNNVINSAMTSLQSAWDNGYKADSRSNDLEAAYDSYKAMTPAQKREVREFATGNAAIYLESRASGTSHKQTVDAIRKVENLKPERDEDGKPYREPRDIQKWETVAGTIMSDKGKDALMKAYMTDYNPDSRSPDTTELKYDYAREVLNLSPEQFAETYRVSMQGKKDEKIQKWIDMGYTKEQAQQFYNLYSAKGKTKIDVVDWHENN